MVQFSITTMISTGSPPNQTSTLLRGRICIVFAHPDDETVALGGQLQGMAGARLLTVTDGAPRKGSNSQFATAADYAAARKSELLRALAIAGWQQDRLTMLGVPDQE